MTIYAQSVIRIEMANFNAQGGPGHQPGVAFTTTNSAKRQQYKWELAIRFMLKYPNSKNSEVAAHIGIDTVTLSIWQNDPDFVVLKQQILSGVLCHLDEDLAEDVISNHLTLKRLVPVAIQNLADLAYQRTNERLRLEASREILDREGHFTKVSRVGLPTAEQGGVANAIDQNTANELINALNAAKAANAPPASIDDPPITESEQ